MRNVSSGPLPSIHTFRSIADIEGPDQTARMPEEKFLHGATYIELLT